MSPRRGSRPGEPRGRTRRNQREALNALRLAVGVADDAGLEAAAPPPEAIGHVQKLAAQGLEQRGALVRIAAERAREVATKEAVALRQAERREARTA